MIRFRSIILIVLLQAVFLPVSLQQTSRTEYQSMFEGCYEAYLNQNNNSWDCFFCEDNYTRSGSSTCTLTDVTCGSGLASCPFQHCKASSIVNDAQKCSSCAFQYDLVGSSCKFTCPNGSVVNNMSDCTCQVKGCDVCQSGSSTTCQTCSSSYPKNVLGKCFQACPLGTYTESDGTCSKCKQNCLKCTSATDCSECRWPEYKAPVCECPAGKHYLLDACFSECPISTVFVPFGNYCRQLCDYNSFPTFNLDGSFKQCAPIWNDEVCYYNIVNLKKNMLIEIDSTSQEEFIIIKVILYETSYNCVGMDLKSGTTILGISEGSSFVNRKLVQTFGFPRENAGMIPSCMSGTCNFLLTITWKQQVQYIFKIICTIQVKNLAVTNIFEFHDLPVQAIDVVCTDCIIPANQIEPSTLQLACADGQICTSNSIAAEIGSIVTFTQKVSSPDLADKTLLPHSLRIDMTQYGQTNSIYIKQYEFNNEIKGQITYSFTTITVSQGTLTATSYIKKDSRILLLSNLSQASKIKYPQSEIGIEIKEEAGISSTTLGIIIGGSCLALIAIAIGFFVLLKRIKCLQQQVADQQKNEKQQVKVPEPQQPEILIFHGDESID